MTTKKRGTSSKGKVFKAIASRAVSVTLHNKFSKRQEITSGPKLLEEYVPLRNKTVYEKAIVVVKKHPSAKENKIASSGGMVQAVKALPRHCIRQSFDKPPLVKVAKPVPIPPKTSSKRKRPHKSVRDKCNDLFATAAAHHAANDPTISLHPAATNNYVLGSNVGRTVHIRWSGKVEAYCDVHKYYKIKYTDGDEEEMQIADLRHHVLLTDPHAENAQFIGSTVRVKFPYRVISDNGTICKIMCLSVQDRVVHIRRDALINGIADSADLF